MALLVDKVECFAQQLAISGIVDDTYGVYCEKPHVTASAQDTSRVRL